MVPKEGGMSSYCHNLKNIQVLGNKILEILKWANGGINKFPFQKSCIRKFTQIVLVDLIFDLICFKFP